MPESLDDLAWKYPGVRDNDGGSGGASVWSKGPTWFGASAGGTSDSQPQGGITAPNLTTPNLSVPTVGLGGPQVNPAVSNNAQSYTPIIGGGEYYFDIPSGETETIYTDVYQPEPNPGTADGIVDGAGHLIPPVDQTWDSGSALLQGNASTILNFWQDQLSGGVDFDTLDPAVQAFMTASGFAPGETSGVPDDTDIFSNDDDIVTDEDLDASEQAALDILEGTGDMSWEGRGWRDGKLVPINGNETIGS